MFSLDVSPILLYLDRCYGYRFVRLCNKASYKTHNNFSYLTYNMISLISICVLGTLGSVSSSNHIWLFKGTDCSYACGWVGGGGAKWGTTGWMSCNGVSIHYVFLEITVTLSTRFSAVCYFLRQARSNVTMPVLVYESEKSKCCDRIPIEFSVYTGACRQSQIRTLLRVRMISSRVVPI